MTETELPPQGYEFERYKQCMQNSARLKQFEIEPTLVYPNRSAVSQEKNKRYKRRREDSGSEYDPVQDDTAEEGNISDGTAQGCNKTNKASEYVSCGFKFKSRKRVYAAEVPTGCTKSRKNTAQPDASLPTSGIPVPPPPPTLQSAVNSAVRTQPAAEDDDGGDASPQTVGDGHNHMVNGVYANPPSVGEGHNHMVNGGDVVPQSDGHGHMVNEDGFDSHEDNTMDDIGHQINHEEKLVPWKRGTNMGHGLQRINRSRRGKLPIIIPEGHIRPLTPVISEKFATECNIAIRDHVPILKHWKEYKKRRSVIDTYLGSLRAKFEIDTEDSVVRNGCIEMMKNAIQQQRHKLKEKHFDPFPLHQVRRTSPITSTSDEEWLQLVESWKTPKNMEVCQKNKDNRALVKSPAATGSCSYPGFVENLGGEFEDKKPDAFDLFKLCHLSKKKKGYKPNVQLAIDEMQRQLNAPPKEGEDPKSVTEVVGDVLLESTKKNMFLQNVGVQTVRRRSNVQNVQAELQAEKMANIELRGKVDDLERKAQETEQERLRDKEEMQKRYADLEAKLDLMVGQHRIAN